METTLLGWPFRAAISCPVTRFHILQLRSKGKWGLPRHIPTPHRAAKARGVQGLPEEALWIWGANVGSRLLLTGAQRALRRSRAYSKARHMPPTDQ